MATYLAAGLAALAVLSWWGPRRLVARSRLRPGRAWWVRDRGATPRDHLMVVSAFAADVSVGVTPREALRAALVHDARVCPHTARALETGDALSPALLRDAERPGHTPWRTLGLVWQLSEQHGARLVDVAVDVAAEFRRHINDQQELDTELAQVRATTKVLAALPLFGLGLAFCLGANPLMWLFGSAIGPWCLTLAIALELTGLWWVRRLVAAVQGQS